MFIIPLILPAGAPPSSKLVRLSVTNPQQHPCFGGQNMGGGGRSLHLCILETLPTQDLRAIYESEALPAASTSDHGFTTLSGPNIQVPLHFKSFTPSLTSVTFHIHCYRSDSGFDIRVPGFTAKGFYWIPSFSHQSLTRPLCFQMSLPEHHYLHVTLTYQPSKASYSLQMVVQKNIRKKIRAWILKPVCLGSIPDSATY